MEVEVLVRSCASPEGYPSRRTGSVIRAIGQDSGSYINASIVFLEPHQDTQSNTSVLLSGMRNSPEALVSMSNGKIPGYFKDFCVYAFLI